MSAVPQKAVKLNQSLTHFCYKIVPTSARNTLLIKVHFQYISAQHF